MRLLSVNLGQPRPDGDRKARTGIFKEPATGAVFVGVLGLEGDAVCNKKHHGGSDQAVYLYAAEDYAWWSGELNRELGPGTFGENLTTEGLDASHLAVGDRLTVGEVELEVTAPRIPCATLERRMGEKGFVKRYMAARRPGAYLRVLRKGRLAAGEGMVLSALRGRTGRHPRTVRHVLRSKAHGGRPAPLSVRAACGAGAGAERGAVEARRVDNGNGDVCLDRPGPGVRGPAPPGRAQECRCSDRGADPLKLDIDKSWHVLHYALTGEVWDGEGPAAFLLVGGAFVGEDRGCGPPRLFMSEEVAEIARAVEALTDADLRRALDSEDAGELYAGWEGPIGDEELGYLTYHLKELKAFVAQSVGSGLLVALV